jgi:hypothetical protein
MVKHMENLSSPHNETADKIFKINDLVDLRLIKNETYIYIENKRFIQCLNVLFNVGVDKDNKDENIRTMDEASQIARRRYSQWFTRISPEEEFMAHCSNIQAFFENNLNTDLLHSDIAFPLLKKLVSSGYKPAEGVFNKEIIKRYNEGTWRTRLFLKSEGYLKYLNREEKRALVEDEYLERYERVLKPREKKVTAAIKGTESDQFMVSLSNEKIMSFLEKFEEKGDYPKVFEIDGKRYDLREKSISPESELDFFFNSIDYGITKIKFLMKEQSTDELTIHRQYLLEIFDRDLLVISEKDGYPTFKAEVRRIFELMGILTINYGNIIKFFKIGKEKSFHTI